MRFVGAEEVRAALDPDALMDELARAFVALSDGETSTPPRQAATTPHGTLLSMAGRIPGALAAKLVTLFPENTDEPAHQAVVVAFDERTGAPLAVMDGTEITTLRTAYASALATRLLAREGARTLAIVGAGVQGEAHARALPRVRDFAEIRIAGRDPAKAATLADDIGARPCTVEEAVRGADVVCLCTDSATAVIDPDWIAPGTHVNSVGYNPAGGELPRELARRNRLVVESRVAFEPPPAGAPELTGLDAGQATELGEILAGRSAGRTADHEITVYKSMGHAVEDVAAAKLVLERR